MKDRVIVDLGCGCNPHETANIAVDINPRNLEKLVGVEKIVHDLNKLPYPFQTDSVDELHSYCSLEHIGIHVFDFLSECYRVLKPDGKLHIVAPNAFHYKTRLRFLLGRYIVDGSFHPFHTKLLKPSYLVDHLRILGFEVDLKLTSRFWSRLGLEKLFPDLFAVEIKLTARKRP